MAVNIIVCTGRIVLLRVVPLGRGVAMCARASDPESDVVCGQGR